MELAKHQKVNVSNLIQILGDLMVKWLSTVKDSSSFPFVFTERNEDGKYVINKRAVIQMYGMRSSFVARQVRSNAKVQTWSSGTVKAK